MLLNMKHLKIAGLWLASMLVMGMALAGTAAATPAWLVCKEGTGSTKYSSNQCTEAEATGKWQWSGLSAGEKETVKIVGFTLTLKDTKTLLGEVEVQCFGKGFRGEGIAEAAGKGEITVAEVEKPKENCVGRKICKEKEVEEVKGAHLPWNTEVVGDETTLANSGAGEPGWTIKCDTSLGSQTDTCESEGKEYEEVGLLDEVSAGVSLVAGLLENVHKAKCSVGGAGAGEDVGSLAILDQKGMGLTVANMVPPITLTPREKENFGSLEIKIQTKKTTFTFKNPNGSGVGMWTPGAPTSLLEYPAGGAGGIKALNNTCNVDIAEGGMCTVEMEFAPDVLGEYITGWKLYRAPFLILEGKGV